MILYKFGPSLVMHALLLLFNAIVVLGARNCPGDGEHAENNVKQLQIQYSGVSARSVEAYGKGLQILTQLLCFLGRRLNGSDIEAESRDQRCDRTIRVI